MKKLVSLETAKREVLALVLEHGLYHAAVAACRARLQGNKVAFDFERKKGDILSKHYKELDPERVSLFFNGTLRQVIVALAAYPPKKPSYEPLSKAELLKLSGQVKILQKRGVLRFTEEDGETLEDALTRTVKDTALGQKVYRQEKGAGNENVTRKKGSVVKDYTLTA